MGRSILWSSLVLMLSASLHGCSEADELGDRVSALEKDVAALEESVGRLNSNAVALHKAVSGSSFLKEVVRTEHGYAVEFTDGTSCDIFFGATAPTKDPLLSISDSGEWMVSMDGGNEYVAVEGATNAFSQDGIAPRFRVVYGVWQVSVDDGLSWADMSGSPCEAASFFSSVVYDDVAGVLTLVLSDGKEVTVCLDASCTMVIHGYDQESGDAISPGSSRMYAVEMSGVVQVIPRLPSGWHLVISEGYMTITTPTDLAGGDSRTLTLILVSEEGLVRQMHLNFTVVSESE